MPPFDTADLGHAHALVAQLLYLPELDDDLIGRALRGPPRDHPFCPATQGQNYSVEPAHNKRTERTRPSTRT